MGWNKRSSGNRYDSNSGHAFIIGALSGKVICMRVYSKTCRICQYANKNQTIATAHECPKNYEGASKSMEVQSILEMTIELWDDHNVCLAVICSDDDSTMKARIKHSFKEKIEILYKRL